MEPGPAGDVMLAFVDEKKSDHFFYNTEYLIGFHKAGKKRENHLYKVY